MRRGISWTHSFRPTPWLIASVLGLMLGTSIAVTHAATAPMPVDRCIAATANVLQCQPAPTLATAPREPQCGLAWADVRSGDRARQNAGLGALTACVYSNAGDAHPLIGPPPLPYEGAALHVSGCGELPPRTPDGWYPMLDCLAATGHPFFAHSEDVPPYRNFGNYNWQIRYWLGQADCERYERAWFAYVTETTPGTGGYERCLA